MNENPPNNTNAGRDKSQGPTEPNQEITAAMARFEKAVQDLVSATAGHLGDRATSLINETSKRIEAEVRLKRVTDDPQAEPGQRRRRRRRRHKRGACSSAGSMARRRRTSRLILDVENKKIAGVCGAVAGYFGFESWAVRLGALTGLIFMPQIIFPAYWILYFIMDKSNRHGDTGHHAKGRRSRRRGERAEQEAAATAQAPKQPRKPPEFLPKRTLRNTTSVLTQAELRLRRLESFVTSDQYELHKALTVMERDGDAGAEGR